MRVLVTILAALCLCITARAQDQSPKQDPPPTPEQASGQEAGEKQEEEKPPRHRPFTLEFGWQDWGLRGNENKFRQYATPPSGFFLREFRFQPASSRIHQGNFGLQAWGESDYRLDGYLSLFHGGTRLEGWLNRNEFFPEPVPSVLFSSNRKIQEGAIRQFVTRDFSVSLRYSLDEQNKFFEVPLAPLHSRNRYTDINAAGRLGNGLLGLSFSAWRYFDRTGLLQDTKVDRWQLRYLWQPTTNLGLEGSFARVSIRQPGLASGHIESLSLGAEVAAGSSTDVGVTLRRDKFDLPAQNAYGREIRSAAVRVAHRFNRWTAQIGLSQREVERVRSDQNFVDVPKWFTFEGRLTGRITRLWKLTVRGATQSLSSAPQMLTVDRRSLVWDSRNTIQLKLDGGTPDLNGYFTWSHRNWQNDARAVDLDSDSFTIGANWQATPVLNLFAEYTDESWSAKSEITAFPVLDNFAPDSRVVALGVNWVINPRAFITLSYTDFTVKNDNPLILRDANTNGHFFTINARYLFAPGQEVGLLIAPWAYRDRVSGTMKYDATVVMLTGSTRF